MRYVSTRGQSPSVGFVDATLAGLAPDGGLYVPETWPTFTHAEIADFWRSLFASLRVTGFEVEHLAMQRDMARSGRPDRLALRFRAQSLHEPVDMDATRFGKGTGRPVELLGMPL